MDDVTDEKLADVVREAAKALNGAILKAHDHGLRCEVRTLESNEIRRAPYSAVEVSVVRPL